MFVMVDCFWHARLGCSPGQARACVDTINSGWRGPGRGGPRPLRAIGVGSPCARPFQASAEVLAVHFQEQGINKTQGSVGLAALQLRRRPGFYRMYSIYKAELTRAATVGRGRPMGRWRVWGFVVSWRAPEIQSQLGQLFKLSLSLGRGNGIRQLQGERQDVPADAVEGNEPE